jgi:N-acetyl-anhydromuramyl-L-alanine amidase AmpD
MKRIILHWTAGTHTPNATDKLHYHRLITGDGRTVTGVPIERNAGPRMQAGYAAHTLNCNTDSIGVAVCCALGATETPLDFGAFPPTPAQLAEAVRVTAVLCRRYGIPCDRTHVLTHGEVQAHLCITQRGKWDLNRLPGVVGFGGDWIRREVKAALAGG